MHQATSHPGGGRSPRDLKLDNTLLDGKTPGRVKLCDFGFAKQWTSDQNMFTHIGCGTPWLQHPHG